VLGLDITIVGFVEKEPLLFNPARTWPQLPGVQPLTRIVEETGEQRFDTYSRKVIIEPLRVEER
jgi:hypothetical protein